MAGEFLCSVFEKNTNEPIFFSFECRWGCGRRTTTAGEGGGGGVDDVGEDGAEEGVDAR